MAFIDAPTFRVRQIRWDLDRPAHINVSAYTGRRTIVANPWHGKWRGRAELAPIVGEANIRAFRAFLGKAKGQINTFRLYATEGPQNANSLVTVASTAAGGANSMTIAGAATPLLAGQFMTVNGQLLLITSTDAETLYFEPQLRVQATAGTVVVTSRPYALVHLASASNGWSVDAGQQYGASIEVEEAVRETDGVPPEGPLYSYYALALDFELPEYWKA